MVGAFFALTGNLQENVPFIFLRYVSLTPNIFNMKPYLLAFGTNEMIIIVIVVLLLFGGRKIPELMRGLGKGVREFNDAKNNVKREIEESANDVKNSPNH